MACADKRAGDLTGVELLALFEQRCIAFRDEQAAAFQQELQGGDLTDGDEERLQTTARVGRAMALAITYGQEARQRYTEGLAHMRGTHNPVDLEALAAAGVSAAEERARFEAANSEGDGS